MDWKLIICALSIFCIQNEAFSASNFSVPGKLQAIGVKGVESKEIFYPKMRFPLEKGPAYANSQVYGHGGSLGPGGNQCDKENYSGDWHDNFCEPRSRENSSCPSGKGHQGQDIRPATCKADRHLAVAASDGVIINIGKYSVTLQSPEGTIYRYLHLNMKRLSVRLTDRVRRGDPIGLVSNFFDGTPTTIHLHFEIQDTIVVNDRPQRRFIPPYTSLTSSYDRLMSGAP